MNKVTSIEPTELYATGLALLKKSNPSLVKRVNKFMDCKLNGTQVPNSYKDHACKGALAGMRECHLDGNVLLVYRLQGDVMQLLTICNHDDLWVLPHKIQRYTS